MKSYLKYSPSSIAGVDQVPRHWKVHRLKSLAQIIPSNVDKKTKEGEQEVYLCNYLDVYNNDFITENDNFMKASASEVQIEKLLLQEGDVIATKDSEDPYDIGIPTLVKTSFNDVVCGYHLTLIRSSRNLLDGNWLYWYVRSNHIAQYFTKIARGITRFALGSEAFKNIPISLPPIQEQISIADFLEERVSLIDETIADKKKLLNLYEEEKKAIINKAVLKGVDPNVKLKHSGVEWLGEIPEHWEVKKLKYFAIKIGSGVTPRGGSSIYLDKGIPLFRSQNIHNDGLRLDDVAYVSQEIHESMRNSKVLANDILLNITGASIGRCNFYNGHMGEANVNQHVCIIRVLKDFSNFQYVLKCLQSSFIKAQINYCQTGGNREGLNFEELKNFKFPYPNIEEQGDIVDFIKSETQRLIKKAYDVQKEIKFLNEYKEALIFEAVTGKIEVPHLV